MTEVSFIFQEHKEERSHLDQMLSQVDAITLGKKEVVLVTSAAEKDFERDYKIEIDKYEYPIKVIGDVQSCGEARNVGGKQAAYDNLVFCDLHICFTQNSLQRLLETLNKHPNAAVGPAISPGEFPSCSCEPLVSDSSNAEFPNCGRGESVAGGVAFGFKANEPWQWEWLPLEGKEKEERVPLVCGCAFSMKKDLFNLLMDYGGFLHSDMGLGAEEEFGCRLARIADGCFIEPRSVCLHLFKGYSGHPKWSEHSTAGFYASRVGAIYVNVFDKDLCEKLTASCKKGWGEEEWQKDLEWSRRRYGWVREEMRPFKDKIDESDFFRII